jgi:hypothetical protein
LQASKVGKYTASFYDRKAKGHTSFFGGGGNALRAGQRLPPAPLALLTVGGMSFVLWRKKKYGKKWRAKS